MFVVVLLASAAGLVSTSNAHAAALTRRAIIAAAPLTLAAAAPSWASAANGIATTIVDGGDMNSPLPEPQQSVVVGYTLWLDGFGRKRIDGNLAFSFKIGSGQVIRGWDITVAEMHVGERRRVVIPPSLGYGPNTVGPIPGNSDLYFDIVLRDVKPTPAQLAAQEKAAAAVSTEDRGARLKRVRAERMAEEERLQGIEYQRVGAGRSTFGSTVSPSLSTSETERLRLGQTASPAPSPSPAAPSPAVPPLATAPAAPPPLPAPASAVDERAVLMERIRQLELELGKSSS